MMKRDVTDIWRPVPGAPGYEVSGAGNVRSLRRVAPRVKRATVGPCGFLTVNLYSHESGELCHRVGSLVAAAFLGPRPAGSEVRRLDGDPLNDRIENLAYGTREDVAADHAKRAEREEAEGAPTHCPEGHRYAPSWLGNWGDRLCPDCRAEWHRLRRAAAAAAKPPNRCADCGEPVEDSLGARCLDCRKIYLREYNRKWRRDHPRPLRRRSYSCAGCNACVELTAGQRGPLPKWCPECKRKAHREADQRFRNRQKVAK